jgi:hypothetical protein
MLGEITRLILGQAAVKLIWNLRKPTYYIYGTLHYPGNSGGNGNSGSTTVANVALNFTFTKPSGLPLQ